MAGGGARPEPAEGAPGSSGEVQDLRRPCRLVGPEPLTMGVGVGWGWGQAVWVLLGSPGGPVLHSSMTFIVDFINFLDTCGL